MSLSASGTLEARCSSSSSSSTENGTFNPVHLPEFDRLEVTGAAPLNEPFSRLNTDATAASDKLRSIASPTGTDQMHTVGSLTPRGVPPPPPTPPAAGGSSTSLPAAASAAASAAPTTPRTRRVGPRPLPNDGDQSPLTKPPKHGPLLSAREQQQRRAVTEGDFTRRASDSTSMSRPPSNPPGRRSTSSWSGPPLVPVPSPGTHPRTITPSAATPVETKGVDVADAGSRGWWNLVRRLVASNTDRIGQYLDSIMDPAALAARAADSDDGKTKESGTATSSSEFGGAFRGGLHSPFQSEDDHQPDAEGPGDLVQQVFVDPTGESLPPYVPMVQWVDEDADNESESGASNIDDAPQTFVVDLVSALKGYRQNPNEVFGHLVAAALASRSASDPVTGKEMQEAGGSIFLTRLMVNSGTLKTSDPLVRKCVQDAVDSLIITKNMDVNPEMHDYLTSFFTLKSVRLSYKQYVRLKACGAEYISLMLEYPHVLPVGYRLSIVYLNSSMVVVFNVLFMILNLAATCMCVIAMAIVLANWMTAGNAAQSYGFYTLIVLGCGYAFHLLSLTYFVRYRQQEDLYEDPDGVSMPSPFSAALPVLPLFDIMCFVGFFSARRKKKRIHAHNALTCSRIGGLCFAMMYAVPQLFAQSYFNYAITDLTPGSQRRYSFVMLKVVVIVQFSIAVLRSAFQQFCYSSINGLGFAKFNIPFERRAIDRHPAAANILHSIMFFVLEINSYLLTASALKRSTFKDTCYSLPLVFIILNAISIIIIFITFVFICMSRFSATRLSFTCIPIVLLQIAIFVTGLVHYKNKDCVVFQASILSRAFVFGYVCWGVYAGAFVLWLFWLAFWLIYCCCKVNLFHQSAWMSKERKDAIAEKQKASMVALDEEAATQTMSESSYSDEPASESA